MNDLEELVGRKLPRDEEELNNLLYSIKCELPHPAAGGRGIDRGELLQDDSELQIENVDTNRPDTWSVEGIARALRGMMGIELGVKRYHLNKKAAVEIWVDKELKSIRPFIACVVAHHPRVNDVIIRGLIQLQEKLDYSYGRKRRRSSIGFYDFDLIAPPLRYGAVGPDEVRFVPLEWNEELSLREILQKHPKGIEYGQIVTHHKKMPILLDSRNNVLSFPPIINSNDLGRITPLTKNILVEITGTSEQTVSNALTILTTALADRGAEISPSLVHYQYEKPRKVTTPILKERTVNLSFDEVKKLVGIGFTHAQIASLLRRARYDVARSGGQRLNVLIPCYRLDILHPVDVLEDVAIAYGLNKLDPRWPSEATIGGLSNLEGFSDTVRELMIGLGFQEVLTFTMSNSEKLFAKMNLNQADVVEISNPKILTLTSLRSWLIPSLMEFLSNNTHVEYPQRLYEVGDCTIFDFDLPNRARDIRKLSCVSAHSRANFTEMKSYLEPLMANLGFDFSLTPINHASFIEGRVGSIRTGDHEVGVIGEIHPQVIVNWKLENPVTALELDLNQLFSLRQNEGAGEAPKPPTSERAN